VDTFGRRLCEHLSFVVKFSFLYAFFVLFTQIQFARSDPVERYITCQVSPLLFPKYFFETLLTSSKKLLIFSGISTASATDKERLVEESFIKVKSFITSRPKCLKHVLLKVVF